MHLHAPSRDGSRRDGNALRHRARARDRGARGAITERDAEQKRRTWITEGVLCSAEVTTGPVPKVVENECATRYLRKQLELLPEAFVIAVGGKAESRIKLTGRSPHAVVFAAGLPGGNFKGARPSWDAAGEAFRKHLLRVHGV